MARAYRKHLGRKTGHQSPVIIFYLFVLLLVLVLNRPACAAFSITTSKTTLPVPCYWITGAMLTLCSGEQIAFSEIQSIDASTATVVELSAQVQASQACMQMMEGLLAQEQELLAMDGSAAERLDTLLKAAASGATLGSKSEKKHIRQLLHKLGQEAKVLQAGWSILRIPDQALVPLRDIKLIQLSIRMQAAQEWLLYLQEDSPTRLAYVQEHLRRITALEQKFMMKFKSAKEAIEQGGTQDPFQQDPTRPVTDPIPSQPAEH